MNTSIVARAALLTVSAFSLLSSAHAQGAKKSTSPISSSDADADADHTQERARWFSRGRVVPGKSAGELRHHAYQSKMESRGFRMAATRVPHRSKHHTPQLQSHLNLLSLLLLE